MSPDWAGRVYWFYDRRTCRDGVLFQRPIPRGHSGRIVQTHPGFGRADRIRAIRIVSRPNGRQTWSE